MVKGAQYAITGTATPLTTILGITNTAGSYARYLHIKNAAGAANILYIGPSTVTAVPANAFGEISAGGLYILNASAGNGIRLDDLYLIGTANAANIAFITVII